jgi:hypothetical protein
MRKIRLRIGLGVEDEVRNLRAQRCSALEAGVSIRPRRQPQGTGKPGTLLCPAPLRTGLAASTASGSSERGRVRWRDAVRVRSQKSSVSSAGPFATVVVASNLSVGAGVVVIFFSLAHLTASARFRVRAPGPVSGRLSATASWRGWRSCPGFPLPFGRRRSLLGHPIPPGIGPPSRSAYRAEARTTTGLPRSARMSCDRGGCPLYPGDGGARPGQSRLLGRRLPLLGGQSLHPARASHQRGSASRGINEGSSDSPVRSSPRLWPPDGTGALGLPRSSAPRRLNTGGARRGGDRPSSTDLELRAQHHIGRSSNPCSSLTASDLASHDDQQARTVAVLVLDEGRGVFRSE